MPKRPAGADPEEWTARQRLYRSHASEETRAKRAAYIASPEAQALAKERYARYRETEKYKAAQLRYRTTTKHKDAGRTYREQVRTLNPERIKARRAIQTLVRRGDIVRPAVCSQCEGGGKIDAHHFKGYAVENWLTVEWLCRRCHKRAHGYG